MVGSVSITPSSKVLPFRVSTIQDFVRKSGTERIADRCKALPIPSLRTYAFLPELPMGGGEIGPTYTRDQCFNTMYVK